VKVLAPCVALSFIKIIISFFAASIQPKTGSFFSDRIQYLQIIINPQQRRYDMTELRQKMIISLMRKHCHRSFAVSSWSAWIMCIIRVCSNLQAKSMADSRIRGIKKTGWSMCVILSSVPNNSLSQPLLRVREKITSHFSILASAHLWPMPHSQNPRNSSLFL
jgi:hypothetical protein